jgi:hypothetical protein
MHFRFTIRDLLWLTLVVASGCSKSGADRAGADPLPSLNDISEVTADIYQESPKNVKFRVPEAHWQSVFDAMRPAQVDSTPASWVWLGELNIVRKEGRPFKVFLFDLSEVLGAFAAGESWETRRYYRGGNSAKLKEALEAAQLSTF